MDRRTRAMLGRRNWQRAWLLAGIALGALLATGIAVEAWRQSLRTRDTQAFVTSTSRVLRDTLRLDAAGSAMEAHHRGYLLTGEARFLQARETAYADGLAIADGLHRALAQDPRRQDRIVDARRVLDARHDYMRQVAAVAEREGIEAARARFRGNGVGSYTWFASELQSVRNAAEARLRDRAQQAEANARAFERLLVLGGGVALGVLAFTIWMLLRQLRRNDTIRDELERTVGLQDAILDAAGYMIIAADAQGTTTLFNRAAGQALGYDPAEVIGKPVPTMHDQAELRERAAAHGIDVSDGRALTFDETVKVVHNAGEEAAWTYIARDGRRFPVLLTVNPLHDLEGRLVGFVGMARDVTERRAAEQAVLDLNQALARKAGELEHTNRELEAFSYTISHDLRAPLRHVDGYARMLREDAAPVLDPEMCRYLDAISDGARHMGTLIDDLLAFSRLGRKPLDCAQVDMTDLARHALVEAGGLRSPADVKIGALPDAWADPVLLRQVWVNLLSNALKYSAPRGPDAHVAVTGERDAAHVRYTVRDNGVGFDMRYADKLFGVFQRLHTHDEFEGTGVGLAIVQRILARHGGRVFADAAPDRGASFTIELPADARVEEGASA